MIELTSEDTALVASITTSFSPVLHRARLPPVSLTSSESRQMPAYHKHSQKVTAGKLAPYRTWCAKRLNLPGDWVPEGGGSARRKLLVRDVRLDLSSAVLT
jgi:hypothetical protein